MCIPVDVHKGHCFLQLGVQAGQCQHEFVYNHPTPFILPNGCTTDDCVANFQTNLIFIASFD